MNIKLFCQEGFNKLESPVLMDGYLYATDGKMAIRIDKKKCLDVNFDNAKEIPVKIDEILKAVKQLEKIDLSDVHELQIAKCPKCNDGVSRGCEECDGTGVTKCSECEQLRDCPECADEPHPRKCFFCNGNGKYYTEEIVVIAPEITVQGKLLMTIMSNLTGVQFYKSTCSLLTHTKFVIYFTFDGGEGVLLPLRNK